MEITGIKYKNMSEAQINSAINDFINLNLHSNRNSTMQKTYGIIENLKKMWLNGLGPVQLLQELKNNLPMV